MRIVFMGTPDFAVPVLRRLSGTHTVLAVVTQPDRPKGRGFTVQYSAVKACALDLSIPVLQPASLVDKAIHTTLKELCADVFVVLAYGRLLPPSVLSIPPFGCINIHASLLPKYRGAAPMQHAIMNGETKTGITVMRMAKAIDTGDMLLQREIPIGVDDTFGTVHDKMSAMGCDCIIEALSLIESGRAKFTPQDHSLATLAPAIERRHCRIDWTQPSRKIIDLIRALDPWPGSFTEYMGQQWKIWRCIPWVGEAEPARPGTIIAVDPALGIAVKTGDGAVAITKMQGEGGKRMSAQSYLRGHAVMTDESLV